MRIVFGFLFLLICGASIQAQTGPVTLEPGVNGDSLLTVWLDPYAINLSPRQLKKYKRKFNRIARYVQKVYPYAQLSGEIIHYYEALLDTVQSEKEQKRIMKDAEDELRLEFEGELRKFTFSQGRMLIKLIDRETGRTSYELIEVLRGKFSAFMWQGIARLFGADLKSSYDAEEDYIIERVILEIEAGRIPIIPVTRKKINTEASRNLKIKKTVQPTP